MSRLKTITFMLMLVLLASITETVAQKHRAKNRARHNVRVVHRVHHRVVVRRAHVRYTHLPRWGTVVAVAPSTAIVIKTHGNPYYFHNGIYYTPRNAGYAVVRPARGIRIKVLPVGYRSIIVGPRNYYYYYGTFYSKTDSADEYETVDAPVGAIIDALPDGYEVKAINGTEYYVLDDVYYAEVDAPEFDDRVGYEVVDINS